MERQWSGRRYRNMRWMVNDCTRCGGEVEPGGDLYRIKASRYEPMQPGPKWDAVGDWAEPVELAGTLCGECREWLQREIMTASFARITGSTQ